MEIKVDYTTKADGWKNGALLPKGVMVHSTATPGVMAQNFRDRWDRPGVGASVHAFLDDTRAVQCLPWDKKAGHCGGSANNTHIGFEICEPGGFRYENGEMAGYDEKKQRPYFEKIWSNAVWLTAHLCKMYGLDPEKDGVVICHSEGHERGMASNHADVMHWFPKHGKNMDDFRKAVKKEMENGDEDMTYEKFLEYMERYEKERAQLPPSDWSAVGRRWAESEGIIKGDSDGNFAYRAPLSREEYVEMEYRQEQKRQTEASEQN